VPRGKPGGTGQAQEKVLLFTTDAWEKSTPLFNACPEKEFPRADGRLHRAKEEQFQAVVSIGEKKTKGGGDFRALPYGRRVGGLTCAGGKLEQLGGLGFQRTSIPGEMENSTALKVVLSGKTGPRPGQGTH